MKILKTLIIIIIFLVLIIGLSIGFSSKIISSRINSIVKEDVSFEGMNVNLLKSEFEFDSLKINNTDFKDGKAKINLLNLLLGKIDIEKMTLNNDYVLEENTTDDLYEKYIGDVVNKPEEEKTEVDFNKVTTLEKELVDKWESNKFTMLEQKAVEVENLKSQVNITENAFEKATLLSSLASKTLEVTEEKEKLKSDLLKDIQKLQKESLVYYEDYSNKIKTVSDSTDEDTSISINNLTMNEYGPEIFVEYDKFEKYVEMAKKLDNKKSFFVKKIEIAPRAEDFYIENLGGDESKKVAIKDGNLEIKEEDAGVFSGEEVMNEDVSLMFRDQENIKTIDIKHTEKNYSEDVPSIKISTKININDDKISFDSNNSLSEEEKEKIKEIINNQKMSKVNSINNELENELLQTNQTIEKLMGIYSKIDSYDDKLDLKKVFSNSSKGEVNEARQVPEGVQNN